MEYLILLIVCLSTISSAQTIIDFIYPPDSSNLTFHDDDTVDVEWKSTYLPPSGDDLYLILWCGSSNLQPVHENVTNYNTTGTEAISFINLSFSGWALPLECHFQLQYDSGGYNNSAFFTLAAQDPDLAPSTWAITSTPSISTTTSSTSTSLSNSLSSITPASTASQITQVVTKSVTAVQTTSATPTNSSKPGGLDTGVKVGIGVGCTVGGLSLLAALAFLLLRSKSKGQKIGSESPRGEDSGNDMVYQKAELSNEQRRHELPEALPHELPGESRLHEFPAE